MRLLTLPLLLSVLTLFTGSGSANAGDRHQLAALDSGKVQSANPKNEMYRGYYLDLSQIAGQQDYTKIRNSLHQQLDMAESVGLSPHVLEFFHSIPIVVDEFSCLDAKTAEDDKEPKPAAACYSSSISARWPAKPRVTGTVWDREKHAWTNPDPVALAEDTHRGVVMVRPDVLSAGRPVLLHEMLHGYHARILPDGEKNRSILYYFKEAKGRYPDDAYVMTNEKEFFAVTASVFLSGKADDGATPSDIQQKQPDYYKFLCWLFEVNPGVKSGTPVASAN